MLELHRAWPTFRSSLVSLFLSLHSFLRPTRPSLILNITYTASPTFISTTHTFSMNSKPVFPILFSYTTISALWSHFNLNPQVNSPSRPLACCSDLIHSSFLRVGNGARVRSAAEPDSRGSCFIAFPCSYSTFHRYQAFPDRHPHQLGPSYLSPSILQKSQPVFHCFPSDPSSHTADRII